MMMMVNNFHILSFHIHFQQISLWVLIIKPSEPNLPAGGRRLALGQTHFGPSNGFLKYSADFFRLD